MYISTYLYIVDQRFWRKIFSQEQEILLLKNGLQMLFSSLNDAILSKEKKPTLKFSS